MPLVRLQIGVPASSYLKLEVLIAELQELAAKKLKAARASKTAVVPRALTRLAAVGPTPSAILTLFTEAGLATLGNSKTGSAELLERLIKDDQRPGRKAAPRVVSAKPSASAAHAAALKESKP